MRTTREAFAWRPTAHGESARETRICRVPDDAASSRHRADQVMKLALDRRHVFKMSAWSNSRFVEDERARTVVDKFCPLIKKKPYRIRPPQ